MIILDLNERKLIFNSTNTLTTKSISTDLLIVHNVGKYMRKYYFYLKNGIYKLCAYVKWKVESGAVYSKLAVQKLLIVTFITPVTQAI